MLPTKSVTGIISKTDDLRRLLRVWLRLNLKYADLSNLCDFPWMYGERAAIGILSSATWQRGGISLEEFWMLKDNGSYVGRGDLYFYDRHRSYVCEAKHMRVELTPERSRKIDLWCVGKRNPKTLKEILAEETERASSNADGELPFGIVFVTFTFRRKKKGKDWASKPTEENFKALMTCHRHLKKQKKFHAVAWYFARDGFTQTRLASHSKWLPGFAIFMQKGKLRKRKHRSK